MDEQDPVRSASVEPGELVYDSDHRPVGRVSGFTDDGFEIDEVDHDESEIKEVPGQEFGEGFLMWRCIECGEMDELDESLPEACPSCSAPREAISVMQED